MSAAPVSRATAPRSPFLDHFLAFDSAAGSHQPRWMRDLRGAAMASFVESGLPTTRSEGWRQTPIQPIAETIFAPADGLFDAADIASSLPDHGSGVRVVTVNGRFSETLSDLSALPAGVSVSGLAESIAHDPMTLRGVFGRIATPDTGGFVALNTAMAGDGVLIRAAEWTSDEAPIHIQHLSFGSAGPVALHPRLLVIADEGAQLTIAETFVTIGDESTLVNAVAEFCLAANAGVRAVRVQSQSRSSYHVGAVAVSVGRDAQFSSSAIAAGGAIARTDIYATLNGPGADCTLNGLYLPGTDQVIDTHTSIDHAMPNCTSHELYKGVVTGNGRGVFNGRILVRPDAQKTDARQTNQALLLSDDARVHTKPELEIFADDVRCTHGATIGQLDADALFYLRARGIGRDEARAMLVHAFARDVIDRIPLAAVRTNIEALMLGLLPVGSVEPLEVGAR